MNANYEDFAIGIVKDWGADKLLKLGIDIETKDIFNDRHLCVRLTSPRQAEIRRAYFWNLTIWDNEGKLEVSIRDTLDHLWATIQAAEIVKAIQGRC
jgi:hypothetical protein